METVSITTVPVEIDGVMERVIPKPESEMCVTCSEPNVSVVRSQ
jgi:hypothetical protein